MPSSLGLGVAHHHHGGGAVVERAGVAGGDGAVLAEDGREGGQLLEAGLAAGAVVRGHLAGAVGERDGDDLAGEEAAVLGGDGALLAAQREPVLLLAGDLLAAGDVLGGLAHGDVDVREALGVAGLEPLVLVLRVVAHAVDEARDALDADGEEDVALAGLDGVRGHARGLQRARAVAGDGGAGHVDVGEDAHHPAEVEALLAAGQAAAADEVLDLVGVELGHLLEHLGDDVGAEVVRADVDQRSLHGAPDRRATGGDDDGFRHGAAGLPAKLTWMSIVARTVRSNGPAGYSPRPHRAAVRKRGGGRGAVLRHRCHRVHRPPADPAAARPRG